MLRYGRRWEKDRKRTPEIRGPKRNGTPEDAEVGGGGWRVGKGINKEARGYAYAEEESPKEFGAPVFGRTKE